MTFSYAGIFCLSPALRKISFKFKRTVRRTFRFDRKQKNLCINKLNSLIINGQSVLFISRSAKLKYYICKIIAVCIDLTLDRLIIIRPIKQPFSIEVLVCMKKYYLWHGNLNSKPSNHIKYNINYQLWISQTSTNHIFWKSDL